MSNLGELRTEVGLVLRQLALTMHRADALPPADYAEKPTVADWRGRAEWLAAVLTKTMQRLEDEHLAALRACAEAPETTEKETRIRELAEERARLYHWGAEDLRHYRTTGPDKWRNNQERGLDPWRFEECPHPDCALFRAEALAPAPTKGQEEQNDDTVEDRVRELLDDADRAFGAGGVAVTMMVDAEIAQYLRSLLPALPVEVTRRCSFCEGTEFDRVLELFGGGWRTRCTRCQRTGTAI